MNAEHSLALARRFIQLSLEKRRLFLASLREEGVDFRLFPIPADVEAEDRDVLSYAQRRMWLLWQLEPDSAAYNLPGAVRLEGPLDQSALAAACTLVAERHPTLRTLFTQAADGEPRQVLGASLPELQQESLEHLPAAEREGEVRARAAAEALAPFDLEHGPLLRWRLLCLEAERHVLLLTLHHIVADGWSMNVLIDELLRGYAALRQGRQPDLAVLPVAYPDFALWQRRWLEAGEGERQLDYWRAQFGERHPVLTLPSDRPRPPLPSHRGERLELELPAELATALRARAKEGEQSLFMWLLASFQILLYRYTGAAEIRVGSPVANRNRQEVEGLIGLFVNTQVLCGRPRAGLSVADFLAEVRQTVLGAQDHQDLPFEQLVEALGVERSLSHGPLFQVLYNHQPQVADLRALPPVEGLSFAPLEGQGRTTQFDLTLDTYEQGGELRAALTYASDLFERPRIERLARHWLTLLAAMVADPRQALDELPLLTAAERTQQLAGWNATQRVYPLEQPVPRLFEAQVRRTPEAPALVFGGQRLSYAELNRRANRLAHALIARGVGPEVLVGVALERSVELGVGLLAILKAGGAYVPLDPDYPRQRLEFLLADSGIRLLLAQSYLDLPASEAVQRLDLDQEGDWLEQQSETDPEVVLDGENLAYVLYTSGSTGQPKGAGNRHRALTNRLCWMQEAYGLDGGDAVLQKTPFSFDVSVWEFFWPLLTGARLVVAAPGDHRDPARLIELIEREAITTLHFVPSMLQGFLQDPGVAGCTSLTRLVCSGEALAVDTQQQVFAKLPGVRLYNLYGPTEAAIDVTHWTCVAEGRDSVPIGRPIANLGCLVLDANLEPVPVGVLGELYLSGVGLGRGYHRRAGLTAERFVANPHGERERLYRTGDLARYRADGVIEYAGRIDHQVKLRGLRIELGEIEARLLEHEAVREAAVLAVDGRHLVGYVVLRQETAGWQQLLAAHLAQSLPEFMVPTQWLALAAMPLSPNGKLERRALPRPDATARETSYQAPATPSERVLAGIWQELLGAAQVGLDDNFFALGGDSIVAIQVVSRARRQGLQLTPRDLFQYQNLRILAQAAKPLASEPAQGPAQGDVALAPVQAAFFARSIPNRAHWNQSLLLQAREPLDAPRLAAALAQLLRHHDALRLRFREEGGQWRQAYAETLGDVLWQRHADSPEALLVLCEDAQRSLDLSQGPLLRALLVDLADGSQRLLLAIHHLVVDGVSWRLLLEDLQRLYTDPTTDLGPRTSAYQAWTAQQHTQVAQRRDELPYWQAQLEGAPTTLPGADPQGALEYRQQVKLELTLDAERTRRLLQEAPAAYRTQVNDLLLTALTRATCRWSGADSLLVELEGHGREETGGLDLSRTLGWFTSLYPVRLTPAEALGASIKAIKEQLRAVPDQGVGYGQLRHLAGPEVAATLAALPQPRITFNYLGRFDGQFGEDALLVPATEGTGAPQDPGAPLANWLTVEGQVYGGHLSLQWGFSRAMFAEADIQALVDAFRQELEALIEHCGDPRQGGVTPSDFPLLTLHQAQLDALPLPFREIEDLYPLSPMQEGLLVHTLMEPHSGIYFMQDRYVIDSEVEVDRFEAAWNAVIQRHDALRASFALDDQGSAYQIIHRQAPVRLSYHDWSERPAEHHEDDLQALLAADRQQGFDLLHRPPFALRLIRRGPAQYWFILSNHHILIDAWCRSLLLQDFFQLYSGTEVLPPAARYRDFLVWLQGQGKAAAIAAWTAELQGFEAPTPLPFDRPITRQGGLSDIDDRYHDMKPAQGRALQQLAQRHGLTVNTLAQAAWALVLQRYSGRHDVLFGVTVAGRPVSRPEMQDTVGLFINSIPLRVRLPAAGEAMSVSDWLHALLAQNLALREHEHLALVDIQACSELERGQPLFDSLFVYENAPLERTVTQGAAALSARADTARTHTNYPLTVVVYPGEALGLHLSYDRRFLDAATVERLLADFARLLVALGEGFQGDVADLPLVAPEQLQKLQAERRDSQRDYPLNQGYASLFEAQVDLMGERLAARCGERAWSYRQLDVQANRVAHGLLAAGVTPDSGVALLAERDLELLALMIGTFKAGAGYVPLDPHLPDTRLIDLLRLAQVPVLICADDCHERACQLLEALPSERRPLLLDWTTLAVRADGDIRPAIASGPNHLAYVIYTSGSTGTPKGVMVEQAGMLNNQLSKVPYLNLGTDDVIAQTASQSFDISVWQFLAAPLFGGCIEILPNVIAHHPNALLAAVAARGVTVLESVPSLIQGLLAEEVADLGRLRWLLPTGEAMSPELARRWLQRYPQVALVNAYGPAECSDDVALFQVDEAATQGACLPIGRATDNNGVLALDDDLLPVPPGAIGELYVAGTGVGRGYLGDPRRTAQAYLPDPFALVPGERCYRSGDLARYRADGTLEYVGRIDQQVKIRGFRIELGEIEARLRELEAIAEAAVVVQEGSSGKVLVAYLVPATELDPREPARVALQASLPDYMVPTHWQLLDRLPLNSNGKVDRKALPRVEATLAIRSYEAPRSSFEAIVTSLWEEVLGISGIGRRANFFELGGHSLLVTQVISRLRHQQALEVPLATLFEKPILADFAACVATAATSVVPPPAHDPAAPLVMSNAQQRLWLLWQLDPDSSAYNLPAALQLDGSLDRNALEASLRLLQRRHDTLRTTFVQDGAEGRPLVHEVSSSIIQERSLAGATDMAVGAEIAAEIARPFDLRDGPLLRVLLLRLAPERHVLVFTVHHIAADGWSLQLLVNEFHDSYAAFSLGREPSLAPLMIRYADYARWQRDWLASGEGERQLHWWRERLGGEQPILELPNDQPRSAQRSERGERLELTFDAELVAQLRAFTRERQVTAFTLLLASFQAVLYRHTGQRDLRLGIPHAGRGQLETEGLVGFFVNTLVLRGEVDGQATFAAWLEQVRATVLAAQTHADLPFEQLVEALQPQRQPGRSPLFQMLYNHQQHQGPGVERDLPGLSVRRLDWRQRSAQFDLALDTEEADEGFYASFTYALDLYSNDVVARFAEQWLCLLRAALAAPDTRLDELPLLDDAKRATLLQQRNATPVVHVALSCLHERISQQAARRPQAVAVSGEVARLTYAELEAAANRLAHCLIAHGVGPEVRVGVSLERDPRLVVALLAVLKAGGAYVPLDPQYPRERLDFLLSDSGIAVLLTDTVAASHDAQPAGITVLNLVNLDLCGWPQTAPLTAVQPDNLAYVIYTSGSTGRPKGALLTHANVARLLDATADEFSFSAEDVWTLFHSYAFDFSVWEIFGALCHGGRLVVVPYYVSRSPQIFLDLLRTEGVTVLNQTPTAFRQLQPLAVATSTTLALRLVIFGGEALEVVSLRPWFDRFGDQAPRLVNMYGITETTVHVTCRPLSRDDLDAGGSPIGRPLNDLRWYVLDAVLAPLPPGCIGELYIGGPGLARGYHHRSRLSAERFLPDPFVPGERLYRSGDLVRQRADGNVDYLGRLDQQVKIRGFRIELGEIEAQLLEQPGVRQVAVLPQVSATGTQLCAYLVPDSQPVQPQAWLDGLRERLRRQLPDYLIPTHLLTLDHLPLTANGKLDRTALPIPGHEMPTRAYVAPVGELEARLAAIWAEVLGVERVGRHDNFFDLGGHSLLAAQANARVELELSLALPLRALFESADLQAYGVLAAQAAPNDQERRLAALESLLDEMETP